MKTAQEIKLAWESILRLQYNQIQKGVDEEGWYSNERNGEWMPMSAVNMSMCDLRNNNTEIRPKSLNTD